MVLGIRVHIQHATSIYCVPAFRTGLVVLPAAAEVIMTGVGSASDENTTAI